MRRTRRSRTRRGLRIPTPASVVSLQFATRQHPPALLKNCVDAPVERLGSLVDAGSSGDDLLGRQLHFTHDAFPLGYLGRRTRTLELVPKRFCINIVRELL